jgi:DNA-binding NarL/FixJ family response regulator
METSSFRILVVDNYEPWRRYVSSTLEEREGLQVVGETGDGLEAVRKAIELRPDLVLLDIGLSGVNGLEAAKQISDAVPGVKLLFATQDRDAEIMKAALSNGAHGYILKIEANHELLPAINAILHGEKFVSGASESPSTFRKARAF